ncbi:MAG: hypothetical protein AAF515_13830 [Pseudomonadota bacterium]
MKKKTPLAPRSALTAISLALAACQSPGIAPPPAPDASAAEQPTAPAATPSATTAPALALLEQSKALAAQNNIAGAATLLERAIRIEPRRAALWRSLAALRLRAGDAASAEQLARKAIALAGQDEREARSGWLLLADVHAAAGKTAEAANLRARWQRGEG